MKRNDSQECRNCHNFEYMDFTEQGRRAVATHSKAFTEGRTCIDCHKGIAHQLPPIDQAIGAPRVEPSAGKFAPPPR
jgi:cytochrome c-type protein NapC